MSPFARALPSCFLDALISTFLSSQIGIGTTLTSEPTPTLTPARVSISGLNFAAVSAGQVSRLCLW